MVEAIAKSLRCGKSWCGSFLCGAIRRAERLWVSGELAPNALNDSTPRACCKAGPVRPSRPPSFAIDTLPAPVLAHDCALRHNPATLLEEEHWMNQLRDPLLRRGLSP